MTDIEVGRAVAVFRGDRSQQWLADEMRERGWKWAQTTVFNIEQGKRPLKFVEGRELAQVLGVEPMDLFGGPEVVRLQDNLRQWTDFVATSFSESQEKLLSLFDALQQIQNAIEEADAAQNERLGTDVYRARMVLSKTPERALQDAQAQHKSAS